MSARAFEPDRTHDEAVPRPLPGNDVAGGGPSWQQILILQREAGNDAVSKFLAAGSAMMDEGRKLSAAADADTEAEWYADRVYGALDGWNSAEDIASALSALSGHSASRRLAIQNVFRRKFEEELSDYLVGQLDEDDRVNGLALLNSDNIQGLHVALGRALIPYGVRESDPVRILTKSDHAGRRRTEIAYNVAFSKIGEGSLRADIAAKLEYEHRQEALALLNHDIAPAERLYLDSVAIDWGTKTEQVVGQVRDTFKAGPERLDALDLEWDRLVVGHSGDDETWTDMSLRQAMASELSGESRQLVEACLDGLGAWRSGNIVSEKVKAAGFELTDDPTYFTPRENAQLVAAEATFKAATTGGYTGAGTSLGVMNEALQAVRAAYESRLERARTAGASPEVLALLEEQWATKRAALTTLADAETSGAARAEAHLSLAGNLTHADRLHLAQWAVDATTAVKVATEAWRAGEVEKLHADAAQPRVEGDVELRPAFEPIISVFMTHRRPFQQIKTILEPNQDQESRGAARLDLELDMADGDAELKTVTEFLTPIPRPLRQTVLSHFMAAKDYRGEGGAAVERAFASWIVNRFGGSTECWNLAAVVDPLSNYEDPAARAAVALERGQGRHAAAHSGWLDALWSQSQADADRETGSDLLATEEESLERLAFIAEHAGAAEAGALDELLAQTGAKGIGELAETESALHTERVEELRKAKEADIEFVAWCCSLAVDVALTAITGGGYGAAVLAAMASSAAGMLAKEAMLGGEYELLDNDNVIELAAAAAGAVVGKNYADKFTAMRGGKEAVEALGRSGAVQSAVAEAAGEVVGETMVQALFAEQLPTNDEIAAKAGAILVTLGSTAAGKGAGWSPKHLDANAAFVRKTVIGNLTKSTTAVTGTAAVTAIQSGKVWGDDGIEFAENLVGSIFKKSIRTFTNTLADTVFPDRADDWGAGTGWAMDKASEAIAIDFGDFEVDHL